MPPRRLPNIPIQPTHFSGGRKCLTPEQRETVEEHLGFLELAVDAQLRTTRDLVGRVAAALEAGATHAQVGEVLRMSETAVSQWVMRSRQRMATHGGVGEVVRVDQVVLDRLRRS